MKKIYTIPFIALFLISCSLKVRYLGAKDIPVQKVDVYVDVASIPREYIIMGKGYPNRHFSIRGMINNEKLQKKAMLKGKSIGADAILFREVYINHQGIHINSISQSDSIAKTVIASTSSTINQMNGYLQNEILFLKYK